MDLGDLNITVCIDSRNRDSRIRLRRRSVRRNLDHFNRRRRGSIGFLMFLRRNDYNFSRHVDALSVC
jgi:hypothetical protein